MSEDLSKDIIWLSGLGELVEQELSKAFHDVPNPASESIAYSSTNSEAILYRVAFAGKHWREVIDAPLLRRHNALQIFSLEGLRFYLPAYMIGVIRYPKASAEWVESLIEILYSAYPQPWPDALAEGSFHDWHELMQMLTLNQKHAVRLWLEYLLAVHPKWFEEVETPGNRVVGALANYWIQY